MRIMLADPVLAVYTATGQFDCGLTSTKTRLATAMQQSSVVLQVTTKYTAAKRSAGAGGPRTRRDDEDSAIGACPAAYVTDIVPSMAGVPVAGEQQEGHAPLVVRQMLKSRS